MDKYDTPNLPKRGRPPKFYNPTPVSVTMEQAMMDWLLEQYPGATKSAAITTYIAESQPFKDSKVME